MTTYRNKYECENCNKTWEDDECDSTHNDRCPDCNAEIEPYESEVIDEETEIEIRIVHPRKNFCQGRVSCAPRHDSPDHFDGKSVEEVFGKIMLHLNSWHLLDGPVRFNLTINRP